MKKWALVLVVMSLLIMLSSAFASNGPAGPAPNSGDGIPDGSGFDSPNGPSDEGASGSGSGPQGPAPNSGDGIPDGSGF